MFSPCSLSARSIQKWAAEDLQYGLKTSLRRCAITTRTGASVNSFAMYACRPSECAEQLMKPVRVVARQIWRESGLSLALQLPFRKISESMGNHDSKIVGAGSVD